MNIDIPSSFFEIPYNGKAIPGTPFDPQKGANCQVFAYQLLHYMGLPPLPPFRSSDLWEDEVYTEKIIDFQPLDLLLFHKIPQAYGAHVGVFVGNAEIIHLAKHHGKAKIESLGQMKKLDRYRFLIGGKRLKKNS